MAAIRSFVDTHGEDARADLLIADINGILRGKRGPAKSLLKLGDPGVALPLSVFGLDVWGREVEATGLHIDSGDRDGFCRLADGRAAIMPWADQAAMQALMTMETSAGQPFEADPRQVLTRLADAMRERGFNPVAAFEMEFMLMDRSHFEATGELAPRPGEGPQRQDLYDLAPLGEHEPFLSAVNAGARVQNLPVDTIIKEAAPGQYEINLRHRGDAVAAADDAVLLRRLIGETARAHGLWASFMAKPFAEEAGNGMHVHVSLVDEQGDNAFRGEEGHARLRHAAGGLLATMEDFLPVFISTVNGFRRLQPGSYAPTRIAWGEDNRSVAVRIPAGPEEATRIEHRLPGADAHPHLVLAAILAGMIEGLDQKIEPPEAVARDGYSDALPLLTDRMEKALACFEASPVVERHFGPLLSRVFSAVKWSEWKTFGETITELERRAYR